ncbi:MAG: hypothetical protein HZC54_13540 [Verrucomicrobia bacterium]|nr:hypothetical protein [Verrucomicrobiota bacterium]
MNGILDRLVPEWRETGGWTYNAFVTSPYLRLGSSESVADLHAATEIALAYFQPHSIHVFHDGIAAWRTKWRGNRGYFCSCAEEVISLIDSEAFFRDPNDKEDNYNVIGDTGDWMITYCHEDDWFLFAPQRDLDFLTQRLKAEQSHGGDGGNAGF